MLSIGMRDVNYTARPERTCFTASTKVEQEGRSRTRSLEGGRFRTPHLSSPKTGPYSFSVLSNLGSTIRCAAAEHERFLSRSILFRLAVSVYKKYLFLPLEGPSA